MKRLFIITTLLLATAAPGFAQLTVNDPAGLAQAIKRLTALEQQLQKQEQQILLAQQHLNATFQILANAQKQLQFAQSQFSLLNTESQTIPALTNRYRYGFSNWQQFAAGNQYGNTTGWITAMNSGQPSAIQTGYRQLVPTVQPVDITVTPQSHQNWRQQYGLLQLQDASIMSAMQADGNVRTNLQNNAQALAQLDADAVSTNPTLQTEKALQQKTLLALLLMIHNLQDTNRMLEANMNMQIQQLSQQRFDRGRDMNQAATDRQALSTTK
jgi:hypothetical protein